MNRPDAKSLMIGALGTLLCLSLMAPRNGSGTYTLPAGNPVVSGAVISSTVHNATMADIRSELTNSVAKDGQTTMVGDLNLGSNDITNVVSLTGPSSALALNTASGSATLANTATAETLTVRNNITNGDSVLYLDASGTTKGLLAYIGAAGRIINDAGAGDVAVRTQGGDFRVSVNSGSSSALDVGTRVNFNVPTKISGTNPYALWYETDAGADAKTWGMEANAGVFTLRAYDDAFTAGNIVMQATRSSSDVADISFFTGGSERVRITSLGGLRTIATTVASLPSCATVGAGTRHFVTDANATTFASVVAAGGANGVPVYCDGTNWRIG